MNHKRHRSDHRHIVERIIVKGTLVLETPTHLGNGDAEGLTDLSLLRDSISECALLTGASIAGALRNYLHEYECNYGTNEYRNGLAAKLFGDLHDYQEDSPNQQPDNKPRKKPLLDEQSSLIVNDAISSQVPVVELRDGVAIDSETGTAADEEKYDIELLAAGTKFPLCFELIIRNEANKTQLVEALAIALQGLEKGEIGIGMKKRRGFGRCGVSEWQVWQFDFNKDCDRLAWLTFDRLWNKPYTKPPLINKFITSALGVKLKQQDSRDRFCLTATFQLASPLIIRSGQHSTEKAASVEHLRSHRNGHWQPVVSGTSLAGVLRHRAARILNTLGKDTQMLKYLFGFVEKPNTEPEGTINQSPQAQASRLVVHEKVITGTPVDLVQSRIAIDRFTGGTYHGALFHEQVLYGSQQTCLVLELELRHPQDAEIGLLLLLLKDLWTGDLPIGGSSSIGRGRLQGVHAEMTRYSVGKSQTWSIFKQSEQLKVSDSDAAQLEAFVAALADGEENAA